MSQQPGQDPQADASTQADVESATAAESSEATTSTDAGTFEAQLTALQTALSEATQAAESHRDMAVRAQAEAENIRRRAERDVSNASKFALERFAKEILAVVDSLEKALEVPMADESHAPVREGIELTYKLLLDTLSRFSIEQVAALGESFDPGLHEAMVMQESDEHAPNSVMHVIQHGYVLNGRLIRPARVIVAKGKAANIDEKA